MTIRSTMLVAVLAIVSGGAAPAEERGDLAKIQGCWEASAGKKKEFGVVLEVKGNEVKATITPRRGPKVRASGELKLDEAASPRALDWVGFSTADGIEVPRLLSIYRLEGDRLILRSGGFNDTRPKDFEDGGEGIWSEVLVFNRPQAPANSAATNPGDGPSPKGN